MGTDFEVLVVVGHEPVPGPDVERVYELVDRREPLEGLRELWADVAAGHGQVVVVEGEAGVGKSRLAYELQHGDAARASWLTVQCSPLASEEPFGPLTAHLPAPDIAGGALARRTARRGPRRRCPVGTGCRRRRTGRPARRGRPLGRSLDGGADRTSGRGAAHRTPAIVRAVHGPSGADQHWLDRTPVRRIDLPPLMDDDMSTLVGAATEGRLPASAVAEIVQRADGLALYAEQLATMVDAPGHVVPSTLQGILTAWLDGLGPELQLLLQRASAIGRVFDNAVLRQLVDPDIDLEAQLGRLVASDVLVRLPGGRHKFRHALLQEAAHESMLQRHRRGVHARIGSSVSSTAR